MMTMRGVDAMKILLRKFVWGGLERAG